MGRCKQPLPQCVKEHGICGGPGQETQSCCDGMFCDEVWGSLEKHCKQPLPQCVKEHGICGGLGQETQSCCGNLVCDQVPGGAELQCKQSLLRGSDLICSF